MNYEQLINKLMDTDFTHDLYFEDNEGTRWDIGSVEIEEDTIILRPGTLKVTTVVE